MGRNFARLSLVLSSRSYLVERQTSSDRESDDSSAGRLTKVLILKWGIRTGRRRDSLRLGGRKIPTRNDVTVYKNSKFDFRMLKNKINYVVKTINYMPN